MPSRASDSSDSVGTGATLGAAVGVFTDRPGTLSNDFFLVVEGEAEVVLLSPGHDYTRRLLAAVPTMNEASSVESKGQRPTTDHHIATAE